MSVVRTISCGFNAMVSRVFVLTAVVAVMAQAQYSRPGSTSAQFLKIGVSPRGSGLGGAYIASVTGAEGAYYNAAALAWVKGTDIVFNHTAWFAGINHEFGAVAHTFDDVGTFGLSVVGMYTDVMKVTTPLQPDGTGETFNAGSYKAALTYSRFLTDRVTVGVSGGIVYEKLYGSFTATSYAVDIAALYVSDFRGFRFGMQIANFGSDETFVNEAYPLPTAFTFGLAINAIESDEHTVMASFSATKPNDGKPLGNVGVEYSFSNFLFARGGYQLYHEVATYSLGAGVRGDILGYRLRFDYSFSNFRLLGGAHRFGLGIEF